MKVQFCKGNEVIKEVEPSTDFIQTDSDDKKPRSFRNETIKNYKRDEDLGTIILASRPKNPQNKQNKNIKNKPSTPKYVDKKHVNIYSEPDKPTVSIKELSISIPQDDIVSSEEKYKDNMNVQLGVGEDFDTSLQVTIGDILESNADLDIDDIIDEGVIDNDITECDINEDEFDENDTDIEDTDDYISKDDISNEELSTLDESTDYDVVDDSDEDDLIANTVTDTDLDAVKRNRHDVLERYGLSEDDFRDLDETPSFEKIKKKKSFEY